MRLEVSGSCMQFRRFSEVQQDSENFERSTTSSTIKIPNIQGKINVKSEEMSVENSLNDLEMDGSVSSENSPIDSEPEKPNYLNLPPEIRFMIINMLGAKGRSKMSRMSKLCAAECQASKFYMKELKFYGYLCDPRVWIYLDDDNYYYLKFEKYQLSCISKYGKLLWKEIMNVKSIKFISEYVNKILYKYRNSLKTVTFNYKDINYAFDIDQITCYKTLLFDWKPGCAALRVLENIKKPVDEIRLALYKGFTYDILKQPQIYQVSNTLRLHNLHLTNQQFRQLSAKNASMLIGNLTEQNIVDFLKSYQNGTLGKTITHYSFHAEGSSFKPSELWKLLGSSETNFEKNLIIRHKILKKRMMFVNFTNNTLNIRNLFAYSEF
ncbi:unnamed protein product [Caenorhabditis angaria]|uniref:F-box domain-containing protein n=1 Tax=Caenorhabditis angaria TaxID=860376 RepID=A0A9P1J4N5_9PELO|nr:unnamed protein product [Caenorhabditis angaria]